MSLATHEGLFDVPVAEVLERLQVSADGLTSAEAVSRRALGSSIRPRMRSRWRLLLRQFANPVTLLLLAAAAVSMVVSDPIDGAIIVLIVAVSTGLGFFQERRADVSMAELLGRVRVHADVIRDGVESEVLLDDVVVGDVVILRPGDVVPADLRLLDADRLLIDESSITGESASVEKDASPRPDRSAALPVTGAFLGSHVVSGSGSGVALAVGRDSRFGALVAEFEGRDVRTHFERQMTSFGYLLARVVLALVVVILIINVIAQRPFLESLMFALAVAVGITPQLLPTIVTVSLSAGARMMATARVLVKRLDAIEDIGAMTILCCDKTGTLTRGVVQLDRAVDTSGTPDARVATLAAMNAGLQRGFPNALDEAILQAHARPDAQLLDEVPYDFERRRLSVLVAGADSSELITKGACASVLAVCTRVRVEGAVHPFNEDHGSRVDALFRTLSDEGFRVLAIATRDMGARRTVSEADESAMTLEGLLAFSDPPTEEAREAIKNLRDLHVEVRLITGDNRHVAEHVAGSVGLDAGRVVTGSEISGMTPDELSTCVRGAQVFAEVDPLQKEVIVTALRDSGQTVGFLGDGINDAAALRAADAGVSVENAADAAKHAAALVLLTKDLDVLADGIRAGRRTFANTLKYVRVTVSANFGNMFSLVIAAIFLPFLPLLPVQILLLNLLSDAPAMTIASDRVDPEAESQPRSWDLRNLRNFMIVFGLASSIIDLSAFVIFWFALDVDDTVFRSGWFLLSLLTECLALLVLRTGRPFWRSAPSEWLLTSVILVCVVGVVLTVTMGGASVGLTALPLLVLATVLALAAAYVGINEIVKLWWGRRWGWLGI